MCVFLLQIFKMQIFFRKRLINQRLTVFY